MKQGVITLITKLGKYPTYPVNLRPIIIHNNLHLVLDLIDYEHVIDMERFILLLDFYKAFAMTEHNFMFQALQTFYCNTSSSVCLPQGTSSRFNINKGIKQGCPISTLLFIAATEMLSLLIKHADLGKISVDIRYQSNTEILISQLADDKTIFINI